jgi:anti-sigma factor RsiW
MASGALPDKQRAAVDKHLATCADCRKYYEEIKSMTAPLANWEKAFSQIEPDQTVQTRWAKDFQAAIEPTPQPRIKFLMAILDWHRDMIWPCRRVWTALSAVWLVILGVNLSTRGTSHSPRPSPEMLRAFLESEGFLAESPKPVDRPAAEPSKI